MLYLFALGVLACFAIHGYLAGRFRVIAGGAQPDLIVGVAATLIVVVAYFSNQPWVAIPLVFATASLGSFWFVHLVAVGHDQFVAKGALRVVVAPLPVESEEKPVAEAPPVEPAVEKPVVEEKQADVVPLQKKAAKKRRAKKEL